MFQISLFHNINLIELNNFQFSSVILSDQFNNLSSISKNFYFSNQIFTESPSEISNVILSLNDLIYYISSPFHPSQYFSLSLNCNTSNNHQIYYKLITMSNEKGITYETQFFSIKNLKIFYNPYNRVISFFENNEFINYYIEPLCDLFYLVLKLDPNCVVDFLYNKKFEDINIQKLLSIPTSIDLIPYFPNHITKDYFFSQINSKCQNCINFYGLLCYLNIYPTHNTLNDQIFKIFYQIFLLIDSNPFLLELNIKNYKKNLKKNQIFYKFLKIFLKLLLNNSKFKIDFLNFSINILNKQLEFSLNDYIWKGSESSAKITQLNLTHISPYYIIFNDKIYLPYEKIHYNNNDNNLFILINQFIISNTILEFIVNIKHFLIILNILSISNNKFFNYLNQLNLILNKSFENFKFEIFQKIIFIIQDLYPININSPLESEKWFLNYYNNFFENNNIFFNFNSIQFLNNFYHYKRFPLNVFIINLLASTSFPFSLVSINQKMVSFQNCPTDDKELIYFSIQNINNSEETNFEISNTSCFSKLEKILLSNSYTILSPNSFFVRSSNSNFDLKNVCFYWKNFSYSEDFFENLILNEIFKWKYFDSIQILLNINHLNYEYLPLSSKYSFEIITFFSYILKNIKNISNNFLNHFPIFQEHYSIDIIKEKINSYKIINLKEKEILNCLLYFNSNDLTFSFPINLWKEISNNYFNLFKYITNISIINPFIIKFYICGLPKINLNLLLKYLIFKINDKIKNNLIQIFSNMSNFTLLLFIEYSTNHWGLNSLINSNNPFIIFLLNNQLEINCNCLSQIIYIGNYSEEEELNKELMKQIQIKFEKNIL